MNESIIAVSMGRCRLQWYDHARRREREKYIRMVAKMKVQGKRKQGMPSKR